MAHKAPGKSSREGITLVQLADMFPDEDRPLFFLAGKAGDSAMPN